MTVVVVAYSPGHHLDDFLDSLCRATLERPQVLVVDNGSTDGSTDRAAQRPGVELIRSGSNLGFGAAANIGIERVTTTWVLVANPDVVWGSGSFDTLLDVASRWPQAAAIGPAIVTPEGDLYPSARQLPSLGTGVGHAILGAVWPGNPWTRAYRAEQGSVEERTTGWISGSCMLLRRDVLEQKGAFDPGFFMYFEDVDLCTRLHDAGYDVVYAPDSVVTHHQGHAANREPGRMVTEHHRSAYRYLAGRYRGARWLPVRLALRAGLAARSAFAQRSAKVRGGAPPQRSAAELGVLEQETDS
ncbi:glycosyltransferase family 2 protein [Blastococcus sp. Marseille-P5729]|uniref:glycosyltransferase family 2 protein n=1 Tax=Blastococcus sp. Marseille-P5729 TaxID=2086582 RepID=UPI001F19C860|nr:glycosyltransferase family 2 protein [Blastococcus sp. Marseille-P5729]